VRFTVDDGIFPSLQLDTSCVIVNPTTNYKSTHLELLSFLKVLAFPNASKIGLLCKTCCSMHTSSRSAAGLVGRCFGLETGEKVSRRRVNSSVVICKRQYTRCGVEHDLHRLLKLKCTFIDRQTQLSRQATVNSPSCSAWQNNSKQSWW
jgi:hypothetical protein